MKTINFLTTKCKNKLGKSVKIRAANLFLMECYHFIFSVPEIRKHLFTHFSKDIYEEIKAKCRDTISCHECAATLKDKSGLRQHLGINHKRLDVLWDSYSSDEQKGTTLKPAEEKVKVKIGLREYVKRKTPESGVAEVVKRPGSSSPSPSPPPPLPAADPLPPLPDVIPAAETNQQAAAIMAKAAPSSTLPCPICDVWLKRCDYEQHVIESHLSDELTELAQKVTSGQNNCPLCDMGFNTKADVGRHFALRHKHLNVFSSIMARKGLVDAKRRDLLVKNAVEEVKVLSRSGSSASSDSESMRYYDCKTCRVQIGKSSRGLNM